MKRALVIISLMALLASPLIGLTACGGTSLSDSDLAAMRGLLARVDNLERNDATQDSKLTKLDSGSTDTSQIKADIASIKADTKVAELLARIIILEDKLSASTTPTPSPSGQCTVEVMEGTPIQLYSGLTPGSAWLTVKITNNADGYRYISYSLNMVCLTPPADVDITDDGANVIDVETNLDTWGYGGLTFTPIAIGTSVDECSQLLFTPSATKIPVAKGGTVEIRHVVQIKTAVNEQWEGTLTGVIISTTW